MVCADEERRIRTTLILSHYSSSTVAVCIDLNLPITQVLAGQHAPTSVCRDGEHSCDQNGPLPASFRGRHDLRPFF